MPGSANPWATELKVKKTKNPEANLDSLIKPSDKGKTESLPSQKSSRATPNETEIGSGSNNKMKKVSKNASSESLVERNPGVKLKKTPLKAKTPKETKESQSEPKTKAEPDLSGMSKKKPTSERVPVLDENVDAKSLYEAARNQLKKTNEFKPGSQSKLATVSKDNDDEDEDNNNPVERLIRQNSRLKDKTTAMGDQGIKSQGQANAKGMAKEASGMSSSSSLTSSNEEKPNMLRSPKDQRKTQEYLLLNYPRDVRKNLKDLVFPDDVEKMTGNTKKADPKAEDWEEEDEDEWEWEEDEDVPEEDEEENQAPDCNGVKGKNEDDDEEEDDDSQGVKGVPEIKIKGNILRIDRKDVVWSDDEYEADSPPDTPVETTAPVIGNGQNHFIPPPPPMPNGIPVAPPPPPGKPKPSPVNNQKVEQLKKRATTTPVWTDLMAEIASFRPGHGKLRKVVCNDRSRPILSTEKVGENFIYESEVGLPNQDILKDIRKGVKLKRVKTNDRSRPCLRGIRNFRRQTTKEERLKNGFAFEEDEPLGLEGVDDEENPEELRDDLESTKQLLELEVRSKKLLEKDNKRLQLELERLKAEFQKMSSHKQEGHEDNAETQAKINSVANKRRQSIVRLLSESDVPSMLAAASAAEEDKPQSKEKTIAEEDEPSEPVGQKQFDVLPPFVRPEIPAFEEEVIEAMKEEVDEARKLAEEWEMKYKEMQRQMAEMDSGRRGGDLDMGRRTSVAGNDPSSLQRMSSTNSNFNDHGPAEDEDEETWMQRREYHQLEQKLRTIADKREIVARERKLLTDRMESITVNIGQEMEARKKLKKDLLEMNEAFKEEIMEMESEEKTKAELEECYYSDEESLVPSTTRRTNSTESEEESYEEYDEDVAETLDDILKLAEDEEEEDPGHILFDHYPESEEEEDTSEEGKPDWEAKLEKMNGKIERHGDNLQTMRKSNFLLKSKIDRLYDILQMQREKHHDLKQELTRMLSDIQ